MRNLFTSCHAMSCAQSRSAQKNTPKSGRTLGIFLLLNLLLAFQSHADHTVPAGVTVDASTLSGMTGVLTVNGQINVSKNTTLNFTSVIINGPSGNINWTKNVDLRFPAGTTIYINQPGPDAGLKPTVGNGNAAQRLYIGTIIIAVSSDNANNAYFSFEQFNEFAGLPQYTITGITEVCAGSPVSLHISPDNVAVGISHSYNWSVTPSASFSPNNTAASVNLNGLTPGTYVVKCVTATKGSKNTIYNTTETITITIRPKNTWLGVTGNWNDAANWCPGVPNKYTDVVIPALSEGRFYPVVKNSNAMGRNITIQAGASITIDESGVLNIFGTLTNNGMLDAVKGTLEFSGTSAQYIAGSILKSRTVRNLIVSNTSGLYVAAAIGDTLNITGNLTFGTNTARLFTGDNITLVSNIHSTAEIGKVHSENHIKGKFIVERYINTGTDLARGQHGKAWMHLATPTIGSTVFESWQESGRATGKTPIANNLSGYGVLLTTAHNNVPSNGYDLYTGAGSSIKTYQSETGAYDKGPVTTFDPVYNEKGYMVLVRGDRSVYTSTAAPVRVVLRTKGEIITGTTPEIKVKANTWASIGNPYASKIYINKIKRSEGVDEFIYLWDPKLGGTYGLGAFQTLIDMGNGYMAIPGGGSYGYGLINTIESGQAFFVQATGQEGSVYFTEDAKESGNMRIMSRGRGASARISSLRTSLIALESGKPVLADGNILMTGDFSKGIDGNDGRKLPNSAENFAIIRAGKLLSVESRPEITSNDTLFFNMTGMRLQQYRLEVAAVNFERPGMEAWLIDVYTGSSTPLDVTGTTTFEFSVSGQAGAAAANRFMIVFRPASVLPVTFTEVKASLENNFVRVEWAVASESNLKHYQVERSMDGQTFVAVAIVSGNKVNGGKYQWLDWNPEAGNNYYRIRSIDLDGKTALTQIVKVAVEPASVSGNISVFPNPVTGKVLNVQLDLPKGDYQLRLINPVGQVLSTKKLAHSGGQVVEKLSWETSLPRGLYHLEISNIQTGTQVIRVLY